MRYDLELGVHFEKKCRSHLSFTAAVILLLTVSILTTTHICNHKICGMKGLQ
jgi:hypothetical protein